jgi:hypothetical protein
MGEHYSPLRTISLFQSYRRTFPAWTSLFRPHQFFIGIGCQAAKKAVNNRLPFPHTGRIRLTVNASDTSFVFDDLGDFHFMAPFYLAVNVQLSVISFSK